jgi:hypothetical protein
MVVAMVAVRMVQVAIDEIIDVIAMGNGFVAATWTMHMVLRVASAVMARCARRWIRRRDAKRMLLDATIGCVMMQMTIVQIVHVVAVLDRRVTAVRSVLVGVVCVRVSHDPTPGLKMRTHSHCSP